MSEADNALRLIAEKIMEVEQLAVQTNLLLIKLASAARSKSLIVAGGDTLSSAVDEPTGASDFACRTGL